MKHMLIILFSIFQLNFLWSDMSPTDKIRGKIICQFAKEMNAKGLHVAGSGGGQKGGKINLVDVCFDFHEVMNVEKARMLIVEASNILLKHINMDIENESKFIKFPPDINIIHISIIGDIPQTHTDYVSCVSITNGNIYYYQNNPEQKIRSLQESHHESFAEALKILGLLEF